MGIPKAVPSAVAPSTGGNNVQILTEPQLGPHFPMTGKPVIPVVPRTEEEGEPRPQPHFTSPPETGSYLGAGDNRAPSVDTRGFMWQPGPIDDHYTDPVEVKEPYSKVNNPPTRGMFTWVKSYLNHIARSVQEVDPNGFRVSPPQQRTSVMRITPPNHGSGFAPQFFVPRQLPQRTPIARLMPAVGTQAYGVTQVNGGTGSRKGVLNRDTFGAGQTAGGIGGNQYTPSPGPPPTVSTAGNPGDTSGMPTWG
jgi:hypothetical protein